MPSEKVYDVLVVGCGASGIAAVTRLFQNGSSVLGLEASDRIGGRVNTVEYGDNVVDMGGQWCHGEENNVVYSLAYHLNLLAKPATPWVLTLLQSNGERVPKEISDKISELFLKVTEDAMETMKHCSEPMGVQYTQLYNKLLKTAEFSMIDPAVAAQALQLFQKQENSLDATNTWFETSAEGQLAYWDCPGDNMLHWKGRGYKTILDVLLKKIPNPEEELPVEVLLNKEVVNINVVDRSNDNTTVQVKCKDGSLYTGKHVIITVSLGVLQERYLDLFSQPLPKLNVMSIRGLELGTVDKIFFHYDQPWWPADYSGIGFLWTDQEKDKFSGEDRWLRQVFGYNAVGEQSAMLCFWISGIAARYMETLPLDIVQDGICRLLQQFFGKQFNIPPPKDVKRSQWHSNKLVRGSYSFRSMSSEILGANQENLAAPVLNDSGTPVICFAGEATSTHYHGTVHGAIEAGFREADRLIDSLKPKTSSD